MNLSNKVHAKTDRAERLEEFFRSLLSYLPANKLHNDLLDLTTQERRISAEVIEYIAEVDRRKLFAELNYPSLRAHPKNPFVHEKLEGRAGQASAGKGFMG